MSVDRLMGMQEVADLLGMKLSGLYREVEHKRIVSGKFRGKNMFRPADVQAYIDARFPSSR